MVDAARPCRHAVGDKWFVDDTYVKVARVWRYIYRAVDEDGQVIHVLVLWRRDIAGARAFFTAAVLAHSQPHEVVTDRAAALAHLIAEKGSPDLCAPIFARGLLRMILAF